MAYSTISKPSLYFNTVTFTGTNGSGQSITGVGFQPDWLWIKHRTDVSTHRIQDAVRGSTKILASNSTVAESTSSDSVTSFDSDGFTHGTNSAIDATGNVVAWNWKAGGAGSANTDGSINTTATSVNTTAGFSISKYTGTGSNATIGHGLGAVPQVVLIKELNGTNNWLMSHQPLSASLGDYSRFITLNSTGAVSGAGNVVFQNSAFTSSVFNVGTSAGSNGSGQNFIAYCFAEKTGYSKFGTYVGNGNADGTFVYTGFKPAFVMIKKSSAAGNNWQIRDNKRPGYNTTTGLLKPNSSSAEQNTDNIDLLSNGFKQRNSAGDDNDSGATYIYMAFAEEPLVANVGASIPATAR
jgi:hypothetical protein